MIKKQASASFVTVDVTRRTRKSKFFHQIDTETFARQIRVLGHISIVLRAFQVFPSTPNVAQ